MRQVIPLLSATILGGSFLVVAIAACGGDDAPAAGPAGPDGGGVGNPGSPGGGTSGGPGSQDAGDAGDAGGTAFSLRAKTSLPGGFARWMTYDPTAKRTWVSVSNDSYTTLGVYSIDDATHTVSAAATGVTSAGDLAVLPSLGKVYVCRTSGSDTAVMVIDGATNAVTKTITSTGTGPGAWIASDPSSNKVFVLTDGADNGGTTNVVELDGTTDTVVKSVAVPSLGFVGLGAPSRLIAVDSAHAKVFALGGENGSGVKIVELDEATLTPTTTDVGAVGNAQAIAVSRNKGYAVALVRDVAAKKIHVWLKDELTEITMPDGFTPYLLGDGDGAWILGTRERNGIPLLYYVEVDPTGNIIDQGYADWDADIESLGLDPVPSSVVVTDLPGLPVVLRIDLGNDPFTTGLAKPAPEILELMLNVGH